MYLPYEIFMNAAVYPDPKRNLPMTPLTDIPMRRRFQFVQAVVQLTIIEIKEMELSISSLAILKRV